MDKKTETLGVLMALMVRLEKQRLPRLLEMKEKVNRGEVLDERELSFLKKVSVDARRIEPIMDQQPQFQNVFVKLVGLYEEIISKDLENEKNLI